jgi:hypothetical protein
VTIGPSVHQLIGDHHQGGHHGGEQHGAQAFGAVETAAYRVGSRSQTLDTGVAGGETGLNKSGHNGISRSLPEEMFWRRMDIRVYTNIFQVYINDAGYSPA